MELLEFACAHPALLDNEPDIGSGNRCCQVEFDEVFSFRGCIKVDPLAVCHEVVCPFLWLWMNQFAEHEVEDGDTIESVEDLSTSVPKQLFDRVLVCL